MRERKKKTTSAISSRRKTKIRIFIFFFFVALEVWVLFNFFAKWESVVFIVCPAISFRTCIMISKTIESDPMAPQKAAIHFFFLYTQLEEAGSIWTWTESRIDPVLPPSSSKKKRKRTTNLFGWRSWPIVLERKLSFMFVLFICFPST